MDCQLTIKSRINKNSSCRARWAFKAMSGRGRKICPWVRFVHEYTTMEFEGSWSIGTKITHPLLLQISRQAVTMNDTPFPGNAVCTSSNRPLIEQIDNSFIERYCQSKKIVKRFCSAKKSRSAPLIDFTEQKIAYHLGIVAK